MIIIEIIVICTQNTKILSTKLCDRVWQSKGVYLVFPPNDKTEIHKQVQTIVMTHKKFTKMPYACYCHFYFIIDTFKTSRKNRNCNLKQCLPRLLSLLKYVSKFLRIVNFLVTLRKDKLLIYLKNLKNSQIQFVRQEVTKCG